MRKGNTSTMAYITRNFFYLLPLAIFPAILLGVVRATTFNSYPLEFFMEFATALTKGATFAIDDFSVNLFTYFTLINTSDIWWLCALGFISLFASFCLITSYTERHMRLGVRSYSRLASFFNESAIAVLPYFITAFLAYEFVGMIVCGMIYVFYVLNITGWLLFAISLVVTVIFYAMYLLLLMLTICAVPSMLADGYRFNVAVSYSARLVATKFGSILLRFGIAFVVFTIIQNVSSYLSLNCDWYLSIIHITVSILCYLFWTIYLPVSAMKLHFELTQSQRKDIQVKLF